MDHAREPGERDAAGDAFTELINQVFLVNGRLLRSGDALTAPFGLTSARWQVMGQLAREPQTVAEIARRRGLARQSVQEVVNRLRGEDLVSTGPNPRDRRAPLVHLTAEGRDLLRRVHPAQADWANGLAAQLPIEQVRAAVALLEVIGRALDRPPHEPGPTGDAAGARAPAPPA